MKTTNVYTAYESLIAEHPCVGPKLTSKITAQTIIADLPSADKEMYQEIVEALESEFGMIDEDTFENAKMFQEIFDALPSFKA